MSDQETMVIGTGDVATVEAEGLLGAPPVDDLAGRKLDHEGDSKAVNELLVPAGRYTTKSTTVREAVFEAQDGQPARTIQFVASEIVLAKDATVGEGAKKQTLQAGAYEDSIEFSFSHQRRDNWETGEPDGRFKTYLKVKAAYKAAMEADPATVDDLTKFIESYPLSLRITRYDGRNFVVDIRPVKA